MGDTPPFHTHTHTLLSPCRSPPSLRLDTSLSILQPLQSFSLSLLCSAASSFFQELSFLSRFFFVCCHSFHFTPRCPLTHTIVPGSVPSCSHAPVTHRHSDHFCTEHIPNISSVHPFFLTWNHLFLTFFFSSAASNNSKAKFAG